MFSSDIGEQILSALQHVFAYELQQQVAGDSLALRTLKQADLQDDPTLTAPYLVYSPLKDEEQSIRLPTKEEEHSYGWCPEIGGPIRYVHFYEAKFGTPLAQTRESARAQAETLLSRIAATLILYMDLSGTLSPGELWSADQSKVVRGNNNLLVTHMGYRIYGGEQTFYGEGKLFWRYPVEWYQPSRFYTGAILP